MIQATNGHTTIQDSFNDEELHPLSAFRTTSERDLFASQLEALAPAIANEKPVFPQIAELLTGANKDALMAILIKNKVKDTDHAGTQKLIEGLIEYLRSMPVVELTIPFDLTNRQMDRLYKWFAQNVKKKVFLKITIDHTLVAGAMVSSNGLYRDFSLKELNS